MSQGSKLTTKDVERILFLADKKVTAVAIADIVGRSTATVARTLKASAMINEGAWDELSRWYNSQTNSVITTVLKTLGAEKDWNDWKEKQPQTQTQEEQMELPLVTDTRKPEKTLVFLLEQVLAELRIISAMLAEGR